MTRVFVVTGSNKGIGKSIVKRLLQDKEEKIVYLTSRNVENGEKAVKELENLDLKPYFHQLDISDLKSVEKLRDHLVEKHGGLDVLVNNAGVFGSSDDLNKRAQDNINVNFLATLQVCNTLFPILKTHARVVHVSSALAEVSFSMLSSKLRREFADPYLTIEGTFF